MTNVLRWSRAALAPSCIAVGLCLQPACATPLAAQSGSVAADAAAESPYESRFAEVRGIRLHYLDFGGEGLPVVFMQSFHGDAREWVDYDFVGFAPRFADGFRVFAVTRRGWGESDDTGWGYDVATQSEDLLGFMDALGIERAVLVGRIPANQDMTWIAEHYPERVAGLVFLGNPYVAPDFRNPIARTFEEAMAGLACDLGEEAAARTLARAPWRPHFLYDEAARLNIPALRVVLPGAEVHSLRLLDMSLEWATDPDLCDPSAREYLVALGADSERLAGLRQALAEADPGLALDQGMVRAFGRHLTTAEVGLQPDLDILYSHIRDFIDELDGVESGRRAEADSMGETRVAGVVHVAPPEGIAHASVVREGEVETDDGVRLYYRVEGEGRDTVVVVHGGPSLGHAYLAPDLVPLARGRAVVHYDQRGIGRSTPLTDPEHLSIERHVQDLDALRAHLGLERLALLGHSWGGMLAARYAAAHPERVERILLLDPMAPAREPFMAIASGRAQEMVRARLDKPARARLDSLAATEEVADPGALCRERFSLLTRIFFEDPAAAARSRADFCGGTPETLRIRAEVDAAIFGSLRAWDVRTALGHVRSPVLVVRGAAGAIPREAMEAWAEAFPNSRLITIERAGHYPHVDRPEIFFPAAEVFFGGGWPEAEASAEGAALGLAPLSPPASWPVVQAARGWDTLKVAPPTHPVESAIRGYLDAYAAMAPARPRARTTDHFLLIGNGYTAGLDRVVEGMDPTGSRPVTHYVLRDLEIEVDGDFAVYRLVVDWYRGENRADGGIGTGHLRRLAGQWRLARDHMTLLPGRHALPTAALVEYAGEYGGLDCTGTDDRLRLEVDDDRLFMTRPDGRPLFGGIRRLELACRGARRGAPEPRRGGPARGGDR